MSPLRKRIVLLGSTGSIGRQTLEVVEAHRDRLEVVALAAGSSLNLLEEQARFYRPRMIALYSEAAAELLRQRLAGLPIEVLCGEAGLNRLAEIPETDLIVNALSGFVGLSPTLTALRRGTTVAMANKEPIVAAGELLMDSARKSSAVIFPIDSEPSALFQCQRGDRDAVQRLLITASGGPFRGWTKERMRDITPEMALRHPNWNMGPKITVDSSSMMNKGLEVIEAHYLFGVDYDAIEVLVHPRSLVHSLVEFKDGSIIGHLGVPDMRVPIQYALSFPERWESRWPRLDLAEVGTLTFEKPDWEAFPCLEMAYAAGRAGGTMPAVLNAADEAAVELFLEERIGFLDIPRLIEDTLGRHQRVHAPDLETLVEVDSWARRWVREKAPGIREVK
ncbi:MAG: 1-deoxy-D-xylulose-5-phosphate reductoisomerase [Firmicutes bacterium]|nr:1-deoxy-D-xylulose-5-phosphate reductoisomerase [Bacillota bacterium]